MSHINHNNLIDQISGEVTNQTFKENFRSNRREFLKTGTLAVCSAFIPNIYAGTKNDKNLFPEDQRQFIIEARYYEKLAYRKMEAT